MDREQLKSGQNILKMRVYTSLIRSFEVTWFDYDRHVYRDVSEGPVNTEPHLEKRDCIHVLGERLLFRFSLVLCVKMVRAIRPYHLHRSFQGK